LPLRPFTLCVLCAEFLRLLCVNTQTFKSELIKKAYQAAQHMLFTDDATVLETFGEKIMLVSGEDENIKLTTPLDLIIAEELLLRN
jgi:2-C-methyl-D-erythritol 4-phosphate cytidylyltransferase